MPEKLIIGGAGSQTREKMLAIDVRIVSMRFNLTKEFEMPTSLTKDEKIVLIAVMKYIVSTDGIITDREIDDINDIAEEKGFEDFQTLFNEVDRIIRSLEDLKNMIHKVDNVESRSTIFKHAVEFSRADADINPHEVEILQYMSTVWKISLTSLLEEG